MIVRLLQERDLEYRRLDALFEKWEARVSKPGHIGLDGLYEWAEGCLMPDPEHGVGYFLVADDGEEQDLAALLLVLPWCGFGETQLTLMDLMSASIKPGAFDMVRDRADEIGRETGCVGAYYLCPSCTPEVIERVAKKLGALPIQTTLYKEF